MEGGEHVVAHLELVDEHGAERGRRAEERAVDHLGIVSRVMMVSRGIVSRVIVSRVMASRGNSK